MKIFAFDLAQKADVAVATTWRITKAGHSPKKYGTSVIEDYQVVKKALQRRIEEAMLQDAEKTLRREREKLKEERSKIPVGPPPWYEPPSVV